LLHIRRPNAFHWKQYVLENPLNEWEQRLKLFHGNNWLTEKGWYHHSNRNFEVFYQELVKLLQKQIVVETETEFLNKMRQNSLTIVDPLDDEVLVKWGMEFSRIQRQFSLELRNTVRVEEILRDQVDS
jgi:hypothetical protein